MNHIQPNRKRIRHIHYDYTSNGYYFVTICVKNWKRYFGKVIKGKMILNKLGMIVNKCWNDLPNHYNCTLDYYSIMPNHFHGILIIEKTNDPSKTNYNLSEMIRGFKSFSSRNINKEIQNETKFQWQKSFYDRIIRNEKELFRIRKYIEQNPLKWELENNSTDNLDII